MAEATCDIGLIGLAVMGQNLVLNMNDHGYKVAVFNRTVSKVDDFIDNEAKGTEVVGAHSVEEMCKLLKSPRRVMIMVKAGEVVDQTIEQVLPYLEKGDIIIDGGNSLFTDSNRRTKDLAAKGFCLSAPASAAAKRVRGLARRLCRAVIRKRGRM
jgi:6-phosphogluconate dehydrogenase